MTGPTGLSSMAQQGSVCEVKGTTEPSAVTLMWLAHGGQNVPVHDDPCCVELLVSGGLTVMEAHASRAASPGNFAVHKQSRNYPVYHFLTL